MVSELVEQLLLDYQQVLQSTEKLLSQQLGQDYDPQVLRTRYAVYRDLLLDLVRKLDMGEYANWAYLNSILPKLES